MRRVIFLLTALTLPLLAATPVAGARVGNGPPPEYFVDEAELPFVALPGATAFWGVHTGAGYRIEVPDDWNGDLVVWAHGFRGTGPELTVDNHPLRDHLIANGFAWAASSYSRNDYDVQVGVQDTHALVRRFHGIVGRPDKVYITGESMGGHIAAVSIEQHAATYDAALPVCGVLGDHELFDYYLDLNLVAQQLGTGGSTFPVDPARYLGVTVPEIRANLESVPGGWPVFLDVDGENLKGLTEQRSGGERPNFDEAWFFWNTFPDFGSGPGNILFDLGVSPFALGRSDGRVPRAPGSVVDNASRVYQFDSDPNLTAAEAALNDEILRVAADPQTRRSNGLAQLPTIDGDIDVPVLALHNLGDLYVPVRHEVMYAQRVAANEKSDLLTQRAIRGVLHCDFSTSELIAAMDDLVAWVETGVKPAGDDFLDPTAVADPNFGCAFTDGSHLLATPCP